MLSILEAIRTNQDIGDVLKQYEKCYGFTHVKRTCITELHNILKQTQAQAQARTLEQLQTQIQRIKRNMECEKELGEQMESALLCLKNEIAKLRNILESASG